MEQIFQKKAINDVKTGDEVSIGFLLGRRHASMEK